MIVSRSFNKLTDHHSSGCYAAFSYPFKYGAFTTYGVTAGLIPPAILHVCIREIPFNQPEISVLFIAKKHLRGLQEGISSKGSDSLM